MNRCVWLAQGPARTARTAFLLFVCSVFRIMLNLEEYVYLTSAEMASPSSILKSAMMGMLSMETGVVQTAKPWSQAGLVCRSTTPRSAPDERLISVGDALRPILAFAWNANLHSTSRTVTVIVVFSRGNILTRTPRLVSNVRGLAWLALKARASSVRMVMFLTAVNALSPKYRIWKPAQMPVIVVSYNFVVTGPSPWVEMEILKSAMMAIT